MAYIQHVVAENATMLEGGQGGGGRGSGVRETGTAKGGEFIACMLAENACSQPHPFFCYLPQTFKPNNVGLII